ncbi:MAG: 6-phosphofructokinase [Rickettsiales bacterium]|jgi:6-phosphofructokinase 1|nr:6-phosphofructokinase [Rickettsiales bacterium]
MREKPKKIAVITTGGDCSGLNSTIFNLIRGCEARGWELVGVQNGTEGLIEDRVIPLNRDTLPYSSINISGSFLKSGTYGLSKYYWDGSKNGIFKLLRAGITRLGADAIIHIGGNGSISWGYTIPELYDGVQVIFVPKTIDMDVPLTRDLIGFATGIQQLTTYIDGIAQSARSHARWFVVEAMGRDSGHLALRGGLAGGADAIVLPEIEVEMPDLVKFVKSTNRDYGIVVVAEGADLKANAIAAALTKVGISARATNADYFQRGGITIANDRILSARFAAAALDAVARGETKCMVRTDEGGRFSVVSLKELYEAGEVAKDPNVPRMKVSFEVVRPDDPYLEAARKSGIFLG